MFFQALLQCCVYSLSVSHQPGTSCSCQIGPCPPACASEDGIKYYDIAEGKGEEIAAGSRVLVRRGEGQGVGEEG